MKFKRSDMGAIGVGFLADALKVNTVGPRSTFKTISLLRFSYQTLTSLYLWHTFIADDGAKHLAEALKVNQVGS